MKLAASGDVSSLWQSLVLTSSTRSVLSLAPPPSAPSHEHELFSCFPAAAPCCHQACQVPSSHWLYASSEPAVLPGTVGGTGDETRGSLLAAPMDEECGELAHCGRRLDSMGTGKQRRGNRKGIRDGLTESVTPGRHWLGAGSSCTSTSWGRTLQATRGARASIPREGQRKSREGRRPV